MHFQRVHCVVVSSNSAPSNGLASGTASVLTALPVVLVACYALTSMERAYLLVLGTDIAYTATWVLRVVRYCYSICCYAGATRCLVLS